MHTKKINHMVIIGCKCDPQLDKLPAIDLSSANNVLKYQTRCFIPSEQITPAETNYSAEMSTYLYKNNKRREAVTLSFHLPHDSHLMISQEDYSYSKVKHDPQWCNETFKHHDFTGQCTSKKNK